MILWIIIIALAILLLLRKFHSKNYNYWKEKGIPYATPLPLFGNFYDALTFRKNIAQCLADLYNQFKSPYFGIFIFNRPYLIIRDPKLIKSIIVKDFDFFNDRTVVSDERCDSLTTKFLFFLRNPEWKIIRSKMTPVFSSGKIKNVVSLINEAAEEMQIYLEKNLNADSIEAKEVCAKYSTDVITSCAFGIQAHSFLHENADFRAVGRRLFDFNCLTSTCQAFYFILPNIVKLFKLPFLDRKSAGFIRNVFWEVIKERETSNYKRSDLIDTIICIKKAWSNESNIKFEGDSVVAQAGQFYVAGFESISSTIAFTLYELCLNKDIQNKIRSEIQTVLSNHEVFTYEAVEDMKYLQMVVHETLRKYPVLPFIDRLCVKNYQIPDTDVIIEKGTPIFIPVFGLHYDPEYFPNPEQYNPERFREKNNKNLFGFAYLPFGKGPRSCIGARFGMTVVKLGLARILSKFEVEKSKDTPVPLKFHSKGFLLGSTVGLPMKFKNVKNN